MNLIVCTYADFLILSVIQIFRGRESSAFRTVVPLLVLLFLATLTALLTVEVGGVHDGRIATLCCANGYASSAPIVPPIAIGTVV